ncbi:MAG: alpha-ketoacid dehydrogenase subunit alpha/beta [Chitinophagaceae bacterium]
MHFDPRNISPETQALLYRNLLLPRLVEEKMLLLLRQGKVSKWFSGIGQEAIAVGCTLAMEEEEWILPLHRNLGVFTTRSLPLEKLFRQWQGDAGGYSKGRERSFHFGSKEHHICGMISHLGPQLSVADGIALAHQLKDEQNAVLVFTGEGGTSEGDFHEALNLAAVWDLPVVFVIENNGYGLSTPAHEQFRCRELVEKARGYGMEGVRIDGNNILTVYDTIKGVREYCLREKKPYLVECVTFRMRGHEEASGTKYVPAHLLEEWGRKDPLEQYEKYLLETGILTEESIRIARDEIHDHIETEWKKADTPTPLDAGVSAQLKDVYALPITPFEELPPPDFVSAPSKRFMDGIKDALDIAMERYPQLILMGQDIAEYGGVFKITEGLFEKYGFERVKNTPLCESAVLGAALGLSLEGMKAMVEMQFADFVSSGFTQIVNNLAKIHYRWGQPADVVIRMPTGAGVGAGPFHSQSTESWFTHVPGLKVVYPSCPADAKGLLLAAFADPNPVLFFEHKALYRSLNGPVPEGYYEVPIGTARVVQTGADITIITYGMGVEWARAYAAAHLETSIYILDLRTLLPLDHEGIVKAVRATGRVLVLHEATRTGGIGGEIASWIGEHCFHWLDAPVMRCASLDTPVPFNKELEEQFLAKGRLEEMMGRLLGY